MLTITPRADKFILNSGIKNIRFGVVPNKGCAGYEYVWEEEFNPNTDRDYIINVNDTYNLIINVDQKKYIDDCSIDLKDVDDNTGYKINFKNEKTENVCGCGESLDFPKLIRENDQTWERNMTFRFFTEENNPWQKADIDEETGDATISFGRNQDSVIDENIKSAGDTVVKVDPKTLSQKYKDRYNQ